MTQAITAHSYYALADFLGLKLDFATPGKVEGKGQLTTDWGLSSVRMVAQIFDSFVDLKTGKLAILVGTHRDLGIGVVYDPELSNVDVFILDRSILPARGARIFQGDKPVKATIDAYERMKQVAIAQFRGNVEGRDFKKITGKSDASGAAAGA